jgi:hypothetical protein
MNWGQARKLVPRLPPLRLRRIAKLVLGYTSIPLDESELSSGEFLVLLVAALLVSRRLVGESEQDLILEELGVAIKDFGDRLVSSGGSKLPVAQLVLLDTRYARLSGREGCLDLRTGVTLPRPATAPVEAVAFDLTALYVRAIRAAHPRKTKPDDAPAQL